MTKTKIMIFFRGKIRNLPDLMFGNSKIEVVLEYNYLGIILNYSVKLNDHDLLCFHRAGLYNEVWGRDLI